MVGLNIFKCFPYDPDQFRIDTVIGFFDLCFRHKNISCIDLCTIEFLSIFKESLISLFFYRIEDLADAVLIFPITVGTALQKCFQQVLLCILIQFFDSHNFPPVS